MEVEEGKDGGSVRKDRVVDAGEERGTRRGKLIVAGLLADERWRYLSRKAGKRKRRDGRRGRRWFVPDGSCLTLLPDGWVSPGSTH